MIRNAEPSDYEHSIAFHGAIGFEVETVAEDYDGRGAAPVLFVWRRAASPFSVT